MLQSRGITDLLAAEKEAQAIIEDARKRKTKRLKEAQNEAKTEIEHFKGDRDQRYKGLEEQQLGNKTQMTEKSNEETQVKIVSLKDLYETTKDNLLERILELVCDVKPESHVNARLG
ncbi:unnamed protein product [Adineta steineri]|uniref:V-type proton ATPase subunit G n=1 Tax=Adineta steineri TaxID=433720 RepID=A0A819CYW8_9BILA|nr:unnamed protein product [Adineta steineri]CAF1029922.1 unnamed protein product [Adineta steineri]CAF1034316.1 unnamed protein product [Adineta steineri]CAF1076537.1 unnamed protein product [Adineta steineri]CAF1132049.1 unnamed protein product [Adineta steineri]